MQNINERVTKLTMASMKNLKGGRFEGVYACAQELIGYNPSMKFMSAVDICYESEATYYK